MKRRSFIAGGTAAAALATSGFLGPRRRTPMTFSVAGPVPGDALDDLLASLSPGEWVNLHDEAAQPQGLYDVRPADDLATWAINHDGQDWTSDWTTLEAGVGEGLSWISQKQVIQSWNSGSLVAKNDHVQMYICGAGGHNDYGGNEVYSFDILAAAASINSGGNGTIWVRRNAPARIGHVRDNSGNLNRPFNTNYPYNQHIEALSSIRRAVFREDDPFNVDQRHVGPMSNHTYGGHEYDPDLDGILTYGQSRWKNSEVEVGFWIWSIQNQRWELPPPDHALGAGAQATTGNFQLRAADGSIPFEYILKKVGTDRYSFGRRGNSFRIRLDGTDWSTNLGGFNTQAQRTGLWSGSSYSDQAWSILAPFDTSSPPGGTGSPMATWFCSSDGGSTIWPDVGIDESSVNSTELAYAEAAPSGVDFTTGAYDPVNDQFVFPHQTNDPGFNGQIYALDRTTQQWATIINPGVGSGPPVASSATNRGHHGRYTYEPTKNYHILCYDSELGDVVGKIWLCKGT